MPDPTLIPVFIPPLAAVLGAAERAKRSPLTQAEVEAIRDRAACIMMEPADAERMAESRGYPDVNPENCWADWHRLRPQTVGGYLPRIVLCVVGGDDLPDRCGPILAAAKVEHEFRPRDPKMAKAFKTSSMTWPCFTPDDLARIESHTTVLYALSENYPPAAAGDRAGAFVKLGQQLLAAGGAYAIKCDSSGIAHSAHRWAQIAAMADRAPHERRAALFHAYVLHPIGGGGDDLYTCGMHLLGAPDLIVAPAILQLSGAATSPVAAADALFRAFGIYLLSECPVGAFAPGHTFSADARSPRYRMAWEPCSDYPEDDLFANPFGRWRFTLP